MANSIASVIVPAGKLSLSYGERLLKDIKPETMGRFAAPGGVVVKSNHALFVYGHLCLYPTRMMELLGQPAGVMTRPDGWQELFKAGVECVDDPNGTIYPHQEKVVKFYFESYKAAFAVIEKIDDAEFLKPNPVEGKFKEMAPTVGAAVGFMLGAHAMSHLGQLSAWRRMMGLPAA